jgi:hypothetical protein
MFQHATKAKLPNALLKNREKLSTSVDMPKYYKIVLRSKDADSFANNGTTHYFNNVSFPEGVFDSAVVVMDSFVGENFEGELDKGYTVSIKELMQPRSWGSNTKGITDIVLTGKGGVWQSSSVDASGCGIPVTNPTFFRNARLTVQLDSIEQDTTDFIIQGEWVLTFWIIQLNGENQFSV